MKHTEIEAIMTAKVNEFITKGYTINAATMSGSQGEIAKIDFRKGDEVYRVLLEQTTEYNDHGTRDVAILTVGRSTENVIRDDRPFDSMGPTFWNNRMEIIEQRKFYQVDRRSDYYSDVCMLLSGRTLLCLYMFGNNKAKGVTLKKESLRTISGGDSYGFL